jgi:hypothetical protein
LAVRAGLTEHAALLRAAGARDEAVSVVERFLGAASSGDVEAARAMRAAHSLVLSADDRHVFFDVVARGQTPGMLAMLELGWTLDEQSRWGGTALHWAAWHGRVETAQALIAAGAPLNVRDTMYGTSRSRGQRMGVRFRDRGTMTSTWRSCARSPMRLRRYRRV